MTDEAQRPERRAVRQAISRAVIAGAELFADQPGKSRFVLISPGKFH